MIRNMTIKEKLDTIKGKNITIWCWEEWQSRIIHKYWDYEGFDYIRDTYWDNYGCQTCYENKGNGLLYANFDWYKNNKYKIIRFRDFFDGFDISSELNASLSYDDISEILNKKYGIGNWKCNINIKQNKC